MSLPRTKLVSRVRPTSAAQSTPNKKQRKPQTEEQKKAKEDADKVRRDEKRKVAATEDTSGDGERQTWTEEAITYLITERASDEWKERFREVQTGGKNAHWEEFAVHFKAPHENGKKNRRVEGTIGSDH